MSVEAAEELERILTPPHLQLAAARMPQLDLLAPALVKAQGQFKPAGKSGRNPRLNSEYATLDDIIGAVRKPLADNGLAFLQMLERDNGNLILRTVLLHESGQSLDSVTLIGAAPTNPAVNELQALGSGITYMKRYALSAMLGVATDGDTDGEGAAKATKKQPEPVPPPTNRPLSPDKLRPGLRNKAGWHKIGDDYKRDLDAEPVIGKKAGIVAGRLEKLLPNLSGGSRTNARYEILGFLFGISSTKDLTAMEAKALHDWTEDVDAATQEAAQILALVAENKDKAQDVISETAKQAAF